MQIFGSIIVAGVLSVGLVPERVRGEVIQVYGCAPGWIELGTGEDMICVADPSWTGPGGGEWVGGEDGGGGAGAGGDASEPVPTGTVAEEVWEEVKRVARCHQCKNNSNKCVEQAMLAQTACTRNSRSMAEWRCSISERKYRDGQDTVTAWGCSIDILGQGLCPAAEAPWNQPHRWNWECRGTKCTGPGVYHCEQSWAQSHPEGSTQVVDTGTLSATFAGVGGSASQMITATFNLTAQTGYLAGCAAAATSLANGCTSKETECYAANSCTAADFPQ
jgi:hypothetical protein